MTDFSLNELSKRIDSNEKDINILRERSHEVITDVMEMECAVKAVDNTMTAVVNNQKKLEDRINKVEDTVEPIHAIKKNKKPIFWIIIIGIIIGLSLGNDARDLLKTISPVIIGKVMNN